MAAVNPFIREHAAPLVGSALLHVLVAAGALTATWWSVAPHLVPAAAIEAYVAAPRAALPAPAPAPVAPPVVLPPVETLPEPAVAPLETERVPPKRPLAAATAPAATLKLEAKAAAERRETLARERQAREAAAATRRKLEEAKRAADAQAEAVRRAAAQQRAARESDLARQLAAEEHRQGAENAGLLARYVGDIQARIERAWNRPLTARPGLKCTVYVSQVPGGTVTGVRLGECNGDSAVQQSITLAVYRASPLPAPPDPSLFERNLRLVFAPDD